ncbi:uncharacterized protein LACBIDRAFT_333038 [Laccaria bicolor S238N-H82]|uniref:Predicted protein n=1 Tax=Laccaria bicolor (strain S238N-H82 / ATCC MYA-4686) TaxID=486041 RepID=B0DUM7_LACBS|nr:uncharacterized protein LACBIDRAFT_333038 [Laccaria bicolor S238N-H82]EDR01644.1 predicted protein [Laccaria bicolor S238N-H82]|eukprot:XP_001887720.1 predicted protein [Laccaria bicolor S238N-H82]
MNPDSDHVHPTQSLHRPLCSASSSAILEWDIEPPVILSPPTLPHHPPNPHRVSCAKSTEQLEQSVPFVLDSAAYILASIDDSHAEEQVSVEAPPARSSGFASPLIFRSRSPSPLGARIVSAAGVPIHNLLLSPTTVPPIVTQHSPTQLPAVRPMIQMQTDSTTASTPSLITPTSPIFHLRRWVSSSSPTTTTAQEHPLASLPEPDDDKGKGRVEVRKFANLLVEGKKGADLKKAKGKSELSPSSSSTRPRRSRKTTIPAVDSIPRVTTHIETTPKQDVLQPGSTSIQIQSDDPSPLPVGLSAIPLTHIFKRSLSLLSSNPRSTLPESTITLPSDAASPRDGEASRMGTPGTPSLRRHPYSQTTTTGDTAASFPHLYTPFTSYGNGPRHLQWEDEEARGRNSVGQYDHQYNEQYGVSLEPPNDGSELVTWSTNPNRQGLVAVIQDPHMHSETDVPLSTPLQPPASTDPSNYFYTSQSVPLPASLFSTLSKSAGDYKYDEI